MIELDMPSDQPQVLDQATLGWHLPSNIQIAG